MSFKLFTEIQKCRSNPTGDDLSLPSNTFLILKLLQQIARPGRQSVANRFVGNQINIYKQGCGFLRLAQ